jgi:dTDP-4-dehydrorhamnose reductase
MSARFLLTGTTGQLGWELWRTLGVLGEVHALDETKLDLTNEAAIREAVRALRPTHVVNPAAFTAVDKAESAREAAFAVNAGAVRIFAEEALAVGARMVHFSTDYVFDGSSSAPYREADPTGPVSVYGASKLAGEEALVASGVSALCFRTSWVYAARGQNFLRTMLRVARAGNPLRVVSDQVGAPTWARALAEAVTVAIARDAFTTEAPVYHLSGGGSCSWYDFAKRIFELAALEVDLTPIPTSAYPTPAKRPAFSLLDSGRAARELGVALPDWEESLRLVDPASVV